MALDNYEKELEAEVEKLRSERRMKEEEKERKKEKKKLEKRAKDARNKVKRAARAIDRADRRRAKKLRADAKLAIRERIRDKFWLFFAIFFGFLPVYYWASIFAWQVFVRPGGDLPKLFEVGIALRYELLPIRYFPHLLFVISVGCFVRFMIGKPNTTKDDTSLNKPKPALKDEIFRVRVITFTAIALAMGCLILLLSA